MEKNRIKLSSFVAISIVCIMLSAGVISSALPVNASRVVGFDKGLTWQSFKPLKKATFVEFDKETLVDDYSYLASIPASVFSDGEMIYTNPLLFFQPNMYPDEEKYLFLNDYEGTQYLMEDWMSYCDGKLDKLTTINVKQSDLDPDWRAQEKTMITSDDPYEIAKNIALDDWTYSDGAIISVIEDEYEKPMDVKTTGYVKGEIQGEVGTDSLTIKRPYGPAPEYEYFTIEDEYKYAQVDLWYPAFVMLKNVLRAVPGFSGAVGLTIPSVDPDLQIYCKYEGDWLQTSAASQMAITDGPHEECGSYVYNPGDWRVSVTNMPTEGGDESYITSGPFGKIDRYGTLLDAIKNVLFGVNTFNVDITKYPGVELEIPDLPSFGARDATFKLSWDDDNVQLGLTLLGPSGEELDSVMEKNTNEQELNLHVMGECLEGEHYNVVVYSLNDISTPSDFTVEYSWQQNITKKEGDLISSACQGAILGSIKNNPLLYVKPNELPASTEETLYKLGVEHVYVVDLGGYLTDETLNELSNIAEIKEHYTSYDKIYSEIMDLTGSNDVIFSTIDPWSYWYYKNSPRDLKPDGEFPGAYYFAPAAYAAAHHGSPLLLVDNHPELSGAVTWHVDFWSKHAYGGPTPPIACMYITGTKVYDFLKEYGFDKEGAESILTVAGQYDIGPTWSRMFAGVANPGAIIGTPVDAATQITRCIFYPALIFQNPALDPDGVELINGSISTRVYSSYKLLDFHPLRKLLARLSKDTPGLSNLKIIRESGPDQFVYPVLHTYGCYSYRLNERASNYWGVEYQTRTGYTPGKDISSEEIDDGVREKFEGKAGSFLPDISESDIGPFYASRAGYSNAFSTNFDITMENLNSGVISWYMVLHGHGGNGGWLSWWEPSGIKILDILTAAGPYEENPWRGYEIWWGSTEEPDSATLNSKVGVIPGWLGFGVPGAGLLLSGFLKAGMDIVPSSIAFPDNMPILWLFSQRDNYYDGLVGPYSITAFLPKFHFSHPATEVDEKLENIHSMDFHAGSCLIGCNYLQITIMRHGSVLQECDPWVTSYWASYSGEQVTRDYALGKTVGETYADGICQIGVKYLFEENEDRAWWWDTAENVVLFADPDLRIFVPSTEWDQEAKNNWEQEDVKSLRYDDEFVVGGHMPFGVTAYPHEKEPMPFWLEYAAIIIGMIVIIIVLVAVAVYRKKKK